MSWQTTLKSTAIYVAPFAMAGAETFAEYLFNAGGITTESIHRAFMASVILETGLLKIQVQNWLKAQGSLATVVASNTAAIASVAPPAPKVVQ
jgi:hypothetical protein